MIFNKSRIAGWALLFSLLSAGLLDAAETASSGKAATILKQSGVQGGLVVHLDCGNGTLTTALRANEKYLVHGLTRKSSELLAARKSLLGEGVYGMVSLDSYDGKTLPYNDNLVNLIVCEGTPSVPEKEILRVLAPLGVAWINGQKTQKPWPSDIDEWNHFLNDADNNAVAKDTQIGEPRSLQWVMGPKWGRSHEEMASMSACVSAKGRIFYIVDQAPLISIRFNSNWKLVARDAFNGTLLWERDINRWVDHLRDFRSGPVHLPRRLVAVGDEVYVTRGIDAAVEALDAATGETLRTYPGTAYADELLCDDGILYTLIGSSEVRRQGEGLSARNEPTPVDYRRIEAFDVKSGKKLWKVEPPKEEFILPLTLTKKDSRLIFQTIKRLICVDARTGSKLWETPRETPDKRLAWSALTVVMSENVVFVADRSATGTATSKKKKGEEGKAESVLTTSPAKSGPVELGVDGWDVPGFIRKDSNVYVTAYDIATGKELWTCSATEGYNAPVDIFVIGSDVWIGSTFSEARDVLTGKVTRTIEDRDGNVGMTHARCHRMKATEKYILHSLSGIEVVDLEEGWLGNNSWVRGTCQYGIMPANGLIYCPPEACACFNKVKLQGFKAISAKTWQQKPEHPLEKGSAYHAKVIEPARGDAWSTYRSTSDRGGTSKSSVATSLKPAWKAAIGGTLTQPVSLGDTVIVAAPEKQTVYAFDTAQGKPLWSYTAGGRIDSPPSLWKDRVLFGSHDGWLYCVSAKDGQLCWRLRGAPARRLITSFGQLESAWPLFGSVLVQQDTAIIIAGRNTYVDGGLFICAVDVATGTIKATRQLFDLDPETFRQTGKEKRGWFDMDGSLNDILTGTGNSFYLKHLRFNLDLEPLEITQSHLFTPTGFLGNEWYIRSYWLYGNNVGSGYGGWVNVTGGEQVPAARLMVVGNDQIYGYGRASQAGAKAGHTNDDTYHMFSLDKKLTNIPEGSRLDGDIRDNKKLFSKRADTNALNWGRKNELIARAMVLANDQLLVAGYPDIGKRDSQVLAYENEEDAIAAYQGKRGSFLQVIAAASGEKLSEVKLPAEPVFDGMAVANGRVFVSLKDGSLQCLK